MAGLLIEITLFLIWSYVKGSVFCDIFLPIKKDVYFLTFCSYSSSSLILSISALAAIFAFSSSALYNFYMVSVSFLPASLFPVCLESFSALDEPIQAFL
jgi:hypothetical protein